MSNALLAGLTEQQTVFVKHLVDGITPQEAAARAGYSDNPGSLHRVMSSPAVQAAVHAGIQRSLQQDAPANLRVLRKIRDDESAPARVRADIGVKLLHMAGHVVPSNKDNKPIKPISEMSQAELLEHIARNQEAIDKAEAELMNKAKDVTPAQNVPVSVPSEGAEQDKALNYLD